MYPREYWVTHLQYWWGTLAKLVFFGFGTYLFIDKGVPILGLAVGVMWLCILYFQVLCITIPRYSAIMKSGKVIAFCAWEKKYMIWNPRVFCKRIVSMVCNEVDYQAYDRTVVFPAQGFQISSSYLHIVIRRIDELWAWQRFYDTFILCREGRERLIHQCIDQALEVVVRPSLLISHEEEAMRAHVTVPFTDVLNRDLSEYGLTAKVTCCITFGKKYVVTSMFTEGE